MSDRTRVGIPPKPAARIGKAVPRPAESIAQDDPLARLSSLGAPTGEIERMLAEIEGVRREQMAGSDANQEQSR